MHAGTSSLRTVFLVRINRFDCIMFVSFQTPAKSNNKSIFISLYTKYTSVQLTSLFKTSSGTFLVLLQRAKADEWLKITVREIEIVSEDDRQ